MQALLERLNRFFADLPTSVGRHRIAVWGGVLLVTVVAAYGTRWLEVDMTMESFFVAEDPVLLLHERFKQSFGSEEGVYIVYEARDGDVFSEASLAAVQKLQDSLLEAPRETATGEEAPLAHIVDVTSLVNASYLEVRGDLLISRDFVERFPSGEEEREQLRAQALSHKDFPRFYVSQDSRYGGVWVRTDFGSIPDEGAMEETAGEPEDDLLQEIERGFDPGPVAPVRYRLTSMTEYADFIREMESIIEQVGVSDALKLYPVGNPVLMAFFSDVLNVELNYLLTGALVLMMAVLWVLFRSASCVVWPLTIVVLASVITLGLMGWLGVKMSLMLSVLVLLILVVGIADAVHILSGYVYSRRNGMDHGRTLREVFRRSGLACLLTSVTTAAGMIALVFVPIPPIQAFGFAAAVGVVLAFLLTVLLLPTLLDLWAPISRKHKATPFARSPARLPWAQRLLERIVPLAYRYPVAVIVLFLAIGAGGAYGVSRVRVDSNLVDIIRKGLPLREAHHLVDRVMGGTQGLEIFLDFGVQDALKDPRVLNAMEEMQDRLAAEHGEFVVRTESLVNVVKNTYQALNEDRAEMYAIPQDAAALAQTLLLFDSANSEDRQLFVPDDYSQGRISVRLLNYGSAEYLEFFDEVQRTTDEVFAPLKANYPNLEVGITGSLALIMKFADYIGRAQLQSFALVLVVVVVTVLLLIVFGSPTVGLLAMIPNVYPVVITFGVMGLLEIPLDADTLIIAPILIGIAVDDTIHFITHYRALVLEHGDPVRAITGTVREVGQAITFTSVILVLGFLILVVSSHQGMANFGFLIGIAFATALLADLLMLPSLLVLFRVRFGQRALLGR